MSGENIQTWLISTCHTSPPPQLIEKVEEVKIFVFLVLRNFGHNIFFLNALFEKFLPKNQNLRPLPPFPTKMRQNMHGFLTSSSISNVYILRRIYVRNFTFREFRWGLGDFWTEKPTLNGISAVLKLKNEASSTPNWTEWFTKAEIYYFE